MSESTIEVTPTVRPQKHRSRRIADRLNAMQVAIDNTINNVELFTVLSAYGYSMERLEEGRRLYQSVLKLHLEQKAGYGNKHTNVDAFQRAWDQANTTYVRLVKVARVALKDYRGDWHALALGGERERTFAGWVAQAQQFYTNALANPDTLQRLAAYGITQAKLEAGQTAVLAAEMTNAEQKNGKGVAQHATQARDAALSELTRWYTDFITIARIAFEDQPQSLEKLGVIVPTA